MKTVLRVFLKSIVYAATLGLGLMCVVNLGAVFTAIWVSWGWIIKSLIFFAAVGVVALAMLILEIFLDIKYSKVKYTKKTAIAQIITSFVLSIIMMGMWMDIIWHLSKLA